jgi:hypothetical protein
MDEVWTAPGDDSTLDEKLKFQRKLRAYLEEPWNLFAPWIKGVTTLEDHRWWHDPFAPPPEFLAKQQKKRMERQIKRLSKPDHGVPVGVAIRKRRDRD